ncbi:MAG TPA: helix-turn-helix transcriptional regulator [Phycisphaerales bacterium]|nr:helix-turn-helix transcriptional regulator [Phycisphaerales bacterium]
MRVERELMRGAGPAAVLKLLEVRGEMYGYELVEAVSKQSEGVLAMGQSTLYPLLYNLEAKGLIKSRWKSGKAQRDRKYYSLTAKGKTRLAKEEAQWNALAEAMRGLGVVSGAKRVRLAGGGEIAGGA